MSGWFYRKSGMLEDTTYGPLSDDAILQLAFDAKISAQTLVAHPQRTQGKWVPAKTDAALAQRLREGEQSRAQVKAAEQQRKDQQRQERQELAEQHRAAQADQRASNPWMRFLADGQPEATVAAVSERLKSILTPQETLEYIAVQGKPMVIAADCVAITNRRLIIFRPKMLGQMTFDDFLWMYLADAKLKEGMIFAELSFRYGAGQVVSIDYLPKQQARRVYQIAQQREEMAIEVRRQRQMEETRAGASNIVVNSGPAPAVPAVAGASEDPVAKLQKLKTMLDQGLIEKSEYDAAKAKILSAM